MFGVANNQQLNNGCKCEWVYGNIWNYPNWKLILFESGYDFTFAADSWVKFFQAAGVPSAAAATYAHIFFENRMDLDMLTDLNKEYLREMGIHPMGDIISILR